MTCWDFVLKPLAVLRLEAPPNALWLHIVLTFFLIKFSFLLSGSVLVLLVFRDQVVHVAFSFGKFHLIHAFASIPMEECPSTEHGCEVFRHTLEHLLNCSGIASERD